MQFAYSVAALVILLFSATARAVEPTVWFCPLDPFLRPEVGYGGSPEYMNLFSQAGSWTQAAAHLHVFKIYPQWIGAASDADLQQQFAYLKRHKIALGLEFGVMNLSGTCGRGVEGFGGQGLLQAARRIQRNGGTLSYVAMDEPIYFGSIYSGHNACNWTPEQAVAAAAPNLKAMCAAYPMVKVGEVEPLANSPMDRTIERYKRGIEAFHKALGVPLAFFHADINWKASPRSLENLIALRKMVESEHIPFGVIYNGNPDDATSADWIAAAQTRITEAEAAAGTPDHVIFQSWHHQPQKLLPEDAPDSFTHLINAYFRPRTTLSLALSGDTLSGKLSTANGQPIGGAPIEMRIRSLSKEGVMGNCSATGTVPAGCTAIRFGVRANIEGGFSANNIDVRIRKFRLQTKSGWAAVGAFQENTEAKDWSGVKWKTGQDAAGESGVLHLTVPVGQQVALNSPEIQMQTQGQPFTFSVEAQIARASEGGGYFAVFFLNGSHEFSRAMILFQAPSTPVGTVTTASDGTWKMKLPEQAGKSFVAEAGYAGDEKHWSAQNSATMENAAVPEQQPDSR
jgi:hypothetical protein